MTDVAETDTITAMQNKGVVDELRQMFEGQAENAVLSLTPPSKSRKAKPRLLPKAKVDGTGTTGYQYVSQHDSGYIPGDTSAVPEIDSREEAVGSSLNKEDESPRNVPDEEDIKDCGDLNTAQQHTSSGHLTEGNGVFHLEIGSSHAIVDDEGHQQTKEDRRLQKTEGKTESWYNQV